jgi:flagellar protein FlgJ
MLYVNPLLSSERTVAEQTVQSGAREEMAVEELEKFFVYMLIKEMRKTVPEGGLLDSGLASRMQEQFLDDALAGAIAESGQMGVGSMVREQLHADGMQNRLGEVKTQVGALREHGEEAAAAIPLWRQGPGGRLTPANHRHGRIADNQDDDPEARALWTRSSTGRLVPINKANEQYGLHEAESGGERAATPRRTMRAAGRGM